MLELYKRIKNRREELKMTQDALAKKVGYKSRTSIHKIKLGVKNSKQYYRPVNVEESELLDDYREVPVEYKSLIRGMLKRLNIGRVPH